MSHPMHKWLMNDPALYVYCIIVMFKHMCSVLISSLRTWHILTEMIQKLHKFEKENDIPIFTSKANEPTVRLDQNHK